MTLKTLLVAAVLAAIITPASAQVAGNLPFSVAIYDGNGQVVANGVPAGGMTQIYKLDGRYVGRLSTSAYRVGDIVSLFETHVGCTDQAKAEMARLAPNNADRVNCDLLPPSVPYLVVQDASRSVPNMPNMLCIRPQQRPDVGCLWIFTYVQVEAR